MSQSLFNTGKIGVFLDGFSPSTEDRQGEETKVVTLAMRIQPFTKTHAVAIDEGLGEDSNVRQTLFNLTTDAPKAHLDRANMSLGCPPQNLLVHAAPDAADPRIAFLQAKIKGVYARTQKDVNGFALCFQATFGPVSAAELHYLMQWYLSQQFVTFEAAQPTLDANAGDDLDVRVPAPKDQPLAPSWDDGDTAPAPSTADAASGAATEAAMRAKPRGTRKKTERHNPEAEATAQEAAGQAAAAGETAEASA